MNEINFAVLGTGGIGRRTLEVSKYKESLNPVAACDRNGIAIDSEGLDVSELLDATEGNIASDPDPRTDGGVAVKQTGENAGVAASTQGKRTETPIKEIIEVSATADAVLIALPNLEHDFIPQVADRFAEAGYSGVLVDVPGRGTRTGTRTGPGPGPDAD